MVQEIGQASEAHSKVQTYFLALDFAANKTRETIGRCTTMSNAYSIVTILRLHTFLSVTWVTQGLRELNFSKAWFKGDGINFHKAHETDGQRAAMPGVG